MQNSTKMPIVSIQRHRINSDGNGVRTLVHSYGCNLSCKWCCNPETRYGNKFVLSTSKELFHAVKLDDLYFITTGGGITFSGGEPLLHKDFIKEFSELAHDYNWKIGVESAFYIDKSLIEEVSSFIDDFYIDIKVMDSEIHKKCTGVSNEKILNNIQFLSKIIPEKIHISIPIIPTVNDSEKNLMETISFMKKNKLQNLKLLPYRNYKKEKYDVMNIPYELNVYYDEKHFNKLQNIVKKEFKKGEINE